MRGLKQDRSARVIIAGHGFVQDLRRGHDELATDEPAGRRVAATFAEQVFAIWSRRVPSLQHTANWRNATDPAWAALAWCGGQVKPSGIC